MIELLVGVVVGVLAGLASGVAGIGGGVVMVPAMVFLLGMEQATAQGTSLVAIVFAAVAGTGVNVRNRRADLPVALVLGLAGVVAAQVGKEAALALPSETLQRLFGGLVLLSGIQMGVRGLQARRALSRG